MADFITNIPDLALFGQYISQLIFKKILSARLFPHAVLLFFREKFTMLVYLRVLLYSKPKSIILNKRRVNKRQGWNF